MFNYIFYRGLTIANYTEYIMYNNAIPKFMENRIIDYNEIKKELFRKLFAIDDYISDDDWYDFQKHKVITSKEIVLEKERIYDNQLFNLTDINKKLGFPINNPIIRISELQKVYERSINDLYGNIFLYNLIKQANDISVSKNICIIKGINDYESIMQIKPILSIYVTPFTTRCIEASASVLSKTIMLALAPRFTVASSN